MQTVVGSKILAMMESAVDRLLNTVEPRESLVQ